MTTITADSLISQIDSITETQWLEGALDEAAPGCPRSLDSLGYHVRVSVDEDGDTRVDLTTPDGSTGSVWLSWVEGDGVRVRHDLEGDIEMAELLRGCMARRDAVSRES